MAPLSVALSGKHGFGAVAAAACWIAVVVVNKNPTVVRRRDDSDGTS